MKQWLILLVTLSLVGCATHSVDRSGNNTSANRADDPSACALQRSRQVAGDISQATGFYQRVELATGKQSIHARIPTATLQTSTNTTPLDMLRNPINAPGPVNTL